jgi:hypothetical protein
LGKSIGQATPGEAGESVVEKDFTKAQLDGKPILMRRMIGVLLVILVIAVFVWYRNSAQTSSPTSTPTDTPTSTPTDTPTSTPTDTPTSTEWEDQIVYALDPHLPGGLAGIRGRVIFL